MQTHHQEGQEQGADSLIALKGERATPRRGGFTGERVERWHSLCDRLTGGIICVLVIFSPWAFGTTQPWAIWTMNVGGYLLGVLWASKWLLRRRSGWQPESWEQGNPRSHRLASRLTSLLAIAMLAILGYCLVSALNARAMRLDDQLEFRYRECLSWLPHSYDRGLTWEAFWNYLALALDFWAIRDWLLVKSSADRNPSSFPHAAEASRRGYLVPQRLQKLIWVLAINGALLAAEGLVQRGAQTGKLLWLIEPFINNSPDLQFGPYAYRSNAAQYFLLAWPLALGLWWLLRGRAHYVSVARQSHNYLLPCILLMGLIPLMTLSRAGALLGAASLAAAVVLVAVAGRQLRRRARWGSVGLLLLALLLGGYMEWRQLSQRFENASWDSNRAEIWRNSWQMAKDYPLYGTGPGTFSSAYELYWSSAHDQWSAHAHNDWLELLVTFGVTGSAMVLGALALVLLRGVAGTGIYVHRLFARLVYLALANCLAYAVVDFPFKVYSVLFLFVVAGALLNCLATKPE